MNFEFSRSFFIFIKKWKTKYSSFFVFQFREGLKNELFKKTKINIMVIFTSMVYTLLKSKFVSRSLKFSAVMVTWTPKICCLKNSGCILMFTFWLLLSYYQNQTSWGVLLKSFQKSFIKSLKIVKVDLKCKQKPWKINVKKFILCSVDMTLPIIWNTFSCSNKLFSLCWTYPR